MSVLVTYLYLLKNACPLVSIEAATIRSELARVSGQKCRFPSCGDFLSESLLKASSMVAQMKHCKMTPAQVVNE